MVRYFAPSSMAVGVTTREACLALPTGSCHVLTADRTFDPDGLFDPAFKPDLPVDRVRARLAGLFPHHPLPHNLDYAHAVVARALRLIHRERCDAVIAHYPNRFTLLAGLIVHVLTRLPLVLHMHDYLSEAMQPIHPLRAWWWRRVERAAFERAALVVVPTPRFAEQYRRRGYHRVFVLPHLVTPRVAAPAVRQDDAPLDIVFTGAIYEATAESARALVEAVRGRRDVRLRFATPNPHDFLGDASVGAVSRQRCLEMQEEADVVFLPLGLNSIYPLELQSCLPSKLLDYLGAGKPVLAVVPPGSYAAELVERYGFGRAVTSTDRAAIREAVDELRSVAARSACAAKALAACRDFSPAVHGPRFHRALRRACGTHRARLDGAAESRDHPHAR